MQMPAWLSTLLLSVSVAFRSRVAPKSVTIARVVSEFDIIISNFFTWFFHFLWPTYSWQQDSRCSSILVRTMSTGKTDSDSSICVFCFPLLYPCLATSFHSNSSISAVHVVNSSQLVISCFLSIPHSLHRPLIHFHLINKGTRRLVPIPQTR